MITLIVNGQPRATQMEGDTPLLWVLRDDLKIKGPKFGCGAAVCGACTVQIDGETVRSCVYPLEAAEGVEITTIEGLASDDVLHPVQQAWKEIAVPQCGYCQSGMIMAAERLLREHPRPTDDQINKAISNLCRCGTYERVRSAIKRAAELMSR